MVPGQVGVIGAPALQHVAGDGPGDSDSVPGLALLLVETPVPAVCRRTRSVEKTLAQVALNNGNKC